MPAAGTNGRTGQPYSRGRESQFTNQRLSGQRLGQETAPSRTAPIRTAITTAEAIVAFTDGGGTVLCNATSGAITTALPAAASSSGLEVTIKKIDASANAVTLDASGAETIDGATTYALTSQYDSVTVHCDGSAWWVLSVA